MSYFDGQVAIITGAGAGIGRAVAVLMAREGAKVVVANRRPEKGEETVQSIQDAGGDGIYIRCDISKPEDVENLVSKTKDHYGAVHIGVNNASIGGPNAPLADYTLDDWHQVMQTNTNGTFYCMKYQIPELLTAGGGAICNLTSILGAVGTNAGLAAYVTTKHAIVGMTRSAALEYASAGVRVNSVGPGYIDTPLLDRYRSSPEVWAGLQAAHPVGRLGEANEVAELVTWLCSDRSSFCTGGYYTVDGGYTAQ